MAEGDAHAGQGGAGAQHGLGRQFQKVVLCAPGDRHACGGIGGCGFPGGGSAGRSGTDGCSTRCFALSGRLLATGLFFDRDRGAPWSDMARVCELLGPGRGALAETGEVTTLIFESLPTLYERW